MSTGDVATIFSGFTTSISDILVANLPLVVAIMAGLIGLGILVHYVVRWVGGHEGAPYMSAHLREVINDYDLRNRTWRNGGNEM